MKPMRNSTPWMRILSRSIEFCLLGSWLAGGAALSVKALPQARAENPTAKQESRAAGDEGREVFGKSCLSCHGMKEVSIQKKDAARWKESVYSMISRGAQIEPSEIEPLVSYLASAYGPDSPAASAGRAGATNKSSAAEQALPAGEGRAILAERCATCHALGLVAASHKTKGEWTKAIDRMIRLGAKLSSAQEKLTLADYLAANFGAAEGPK
jgi:cytochrome c5